MSRCVGCLTGDTVLFLLNRKFVSQGRAVGRWLLCRSNDTNALLLWDWFVANFQMLTRYYSSSISRIQVVPKSFHLPGPQNLQPVHFWIIHLPRWPRWVCHVGRTGQGRVKPNSSSASLSGGQAKVAASSKIEGKYCIGYKDQDTNDLLVSLFVGSHVALPVSLAPLGSS
jgi:hypothetical protein